MKLAQARRFALALPQATEAPHFNYGSFRVRGKIFATFPPEQQHLHVFVADEEREIALELHPEFVEKLHWGGKVVGLRVALVSAKPGVVNELLRKAWVRKAPRALAAALTRKA